MSPRSVREALAVALDDDFGDASEHDAAPTVLGAGTDDLARGRAWLGALADEGWAVPTWPVEYGGRGAAPSEVTEISRELARFRQPDLYPYLVGLHVIGPTLLAAATPEQCARWLPPIRTGEEIWCQLFSEPGAGSDLANLSTRAERDGDVWRLTGQKVWSSRAHYAKWGFCLTRSDVDVAKHAGVTAFAVDMTRPGVDVRPLRQMNGDAHFNEVFLDGVIVPDGDRIAEVGAGWAVARTALANERGAVGAVSTGMSGPTERLLDLARERRVDPIRRDGVVAAHVAAEVARLTMRRARDRARAGVERPRRSTPEKTPLAASTNEGRVPGPEGSGAKLRSSALLKTTADVALSLLGPEGVVDDGEWQTLFLMSPSISIRGGTDEIQRNIVGERVLGLPPEPRVDTDRPYRDIPH